MVRELCPDCTQSFTSDGKPCSFHSGANMGRPAASGRYLYPPEQESQQECSASSDSDDPLLPNEVQKVESHIHDRKRGVTDAQKCDKQSENALPNTYKEECTDVNSLEDSAEKRSSDLILPRNRNNSSNDNHYEVFDVFKIAELDEEVQRPVIPLRKIFKRKLYEKPLQEWDKGNLDGSISNSLTCSFANARVESSINATLEASENSLKLSTGESVTSSIDSLAAPCPSGIANKTNILNISAKTSQYKLSKGKGITSSVESHAVPGPSAITKKTNKSNISAKTSQYKSSKGESLTFSVDSLAVPGPSGNTKKTNESNMSAKTSQSESSFEDKSDVEDKSRSNCNKCKKQISDHVFIFHGRQLYKCCSCNYRNANMFNLARHDYYSACLSRDACNYCNELIWDVRTHCKMIQCAICEVKYFCMTELENHSLGHEKHFKYYCRVCGNKISEHIITPEKEFYKCCKCDYSGKKNDIRQHLYIHSYLKLFKCDLCDKRYYQKTMLTHHLSTHLKCKICGKTFCSYKSLFKHDKKEHNFVGTKDKIT